MSNPSPFALVLPSRPVLTNPQILSQTQYAFLFPSSPSFSHVVVFLVPGITLPPDTLAAVYIQLLGQPEFKFLGALGNEKQSAVFEIKNGHAAGGQTNGETAEDDMTDIDQTPQTNGTPAAAGDITLGISIESSASVEAQLASLKSSQTTPSNALVLSPRFPQQSIAESAIPPKILAQRIIKNAFNFLASFSGTVGQGGEEVVPLRSFRQWWEKFERRVEVDPGFLERDGDG